MINPIPTKLSKKLLLTEIKTDYSITEHNLLLLENFCFEKWKERAKERYQKEPVDLSYSCKFTSLFVRQVLGGHISGNYFHQFCIVDDEIVDINKNCRDVYILDEPHKIDMKFIGNREHIESLESCVPRVNEWIDTFNKCYLVELTTKSTLYNF